VRRIDLALEANGSLDRRRDTVAGGCPEAGGCWENPLPT